MWLKRPSRRPSTSDAVGGRHSDGPATGAILAMWNQPSFDPNEIGRFDSTHWKNRAVTDVFRPGSTFKLFLIAAASTRGRETLEQLLLRERQLQGRDRVFHDHKKYGWLDVPT
jgi:cell division protein FtsI (penicillin-binding protein 3)